MPRQKNSQPSARSDSSRVERRDNDYDSLILRTLFRSFHFDLCFGKSDLRAHLLCIVFSRHNISFGVVETHQNIFTVGIIGGNNKGKNSYLLKNNFAYSDNLERKSTER